MINKKSNTTIYKVSNQIPSKSNEAVVKNKTMRDDLKLGVLKRTSTKKVDSFNKRPRLGSKPTGGCSSVTRSKTKQNSSKIKDTSVSKSSNSEINTVELFATTSKGSKNPAGVHGGDTSLKTSLSKSSESQRNSSFKGIGVKNFHKRQTTILDKPKFNIQKVNLKKITEAGTVSDFSKPRSGTKAAPQPTNVNALINRLVRILPLYYLESTETNKK